MVLGLLAKSETPEKDRGVLRFTADVAGLPAVPFGAHLLPGIPSVSLSLKPYVACYVLAWGSSLLGFLLVPGRFKAVALFTLTAELDCLFSTAKDLLLGVDAPDPLAES
jgi:hypothetical protein